MQRRVPGIDARDRSGIDDDAALHRVTYFEFRPMDLDLRVGRHTPDDVPLKQRTLLACLRDRRQADHAACEIPFVYAPRPELTPPTLADA